MLNPELASNQPEYIPTPELSEDEKMPELEDRVFQPNARVGRESALLLAGLKGTNDIKELKTWTENVGTKKENFDKFEETVAERSVNTMIEKVATDLNKKKFAELFNSEILNADPQTKEYLNKLREISSASYETRADLDSVLDKQKELFGKLNAEEKESVLGRGIEKINTTIDALTTRADKFENTELKALQNDLEKLALIRQNLIDQLGISQDEALEKYKKVA